MNSIYKVKSNAITKDYDHDKKKERNQGKQCI